MSNVGGIKSMIIEPVLIALAVASTPYVRDEVHVNHIKELGGDRCEVSIQDLTDTNQVFITKCSIFR